MAQNGTVVLGQILRIHIGQLELIYILFYHTV